MKLKMNPLWSLGFLVIGYFDIQQIISNYELQQSICGPTFQETTGLTEVTCMGSNFQFSIFHLIIVIFTLIVFNFESTQTSTKLIILILLGITVDLVLGALLLVPVTICIVILKIIFSLVKKNSNKENKSINLKQ